MSTETLPKVDELSDLQLCIIIAQHCKELVPSRYTESLDAMAKAEASLMCANEAEGYMDALTECSGGCVESGRASFTAYFATAKQRAKAFVVAIGKAAL